MIVVLADHIPSAVRGRMKLWFIEVKANVFISGVKDSTARNVVDYLYGKCPVTSRIIIIESISQAPYYRIIKKGKGLEYINDILGLPLIFDSFSEG